MSQSINLYKQLARHKLFYKTVNFGLKRIKLALDLLGNPERRSARDSRRGGPADPGTRGGTGPADPGTRGGPVPRA